MKCLLHHGKERLKDRSDLDSIDVVLTTYHTLVSEFRKHHDEKTLPFAVNWRRIVLDEGKSEVKTE
jgi:SNF2 family DNA or RNA helicase